METIEAPREVAGRYRVIDTLGEGGMGAVYRVVDGRTGREVALKCLRPRDGSSAGLVTELFEREYHTLSELAHPRIIEVYDYGVTEDGAYYTMELLGGEDLRTRKGAPWRQACALLRDVASSLAILHARRLVHCDITPRNVRCTADGRAKLLDFGAMAPMGPPRRTMGTPPYTSPEMVQLQSLDARSDLFSFGALAYWLLTGTHAFPARSFQDLHALWRAAPRRPADLVSALPEPLSDLVMDCLQVNRSARPSSAAVVMERLCAIASLPLEEHQDVAAAYLTTPRMVGRESQLAALREGLLAMLRGKGSVWLCEGTGGTGRTRFLEACVLEAKLQGAAVVRADAGDATEGEYGALRSLCQQLFELAPERSRQAARMHLDALGALVGPELVGADTTTAAPAPERRQLLAAARDFVLAVTRGLRLVVVVDDADRIDEGSCSALVALAHKARRRPLCLVLAADGDGEGSGALDMLRDRAAVLELSPLDETQTEQLVASLFGGATHAVALARRMHQISSGNPRALMQLAQHLLEHGVVRYEAGSFLLPERLDEGDLPHSMGEAMRARLSALSPDARELVRMLALTEPRELPPTCYSELTGHGDRRRTFRATDQLVAAGLLVPHGDRYRLTDRMLGAEATTDLEPGELRAMHRRLAEVYAPFGTITRRGYHLMEAGDAEAAIRVLLAKYLENPTEPRDPLEDYVPGLLDLLERAANAARELALPPDLKVEIAMKTCGASQFLGELDRFGRLAPPLMEQLKRESGLDDFAAVDPALDPMARLTEALTRTQQRHDQTPESERGLAPVDAVRELARLCAMHAGIAVAGQDMALLDRVPSLSPLAPLSPAIECIQRFVDASRLLMQGRSRASLRALASLIERLDEPDLGGLGELYHKSMLLGSIYITGLIDASMGLPTGDARLAELLSEPGHRVNAQRVHQIRHLMQGRNAEAHEAQRRAELVMLQDGQPQRYFGTTARSELVVLAMLGDLMGVKRLTERIAAAVPRYPGWAVAEYLGRYHYRRIQGDPDGALAALEPALEAARPLAHRDWSIVAAAEVQALVGVGRVSEAVEIGRRHLALCLQEDLRPGHRGVAQATAEALLAVGDAHEAGILVEKTIAEARADGVRGLILGSLHELAARVSVATGDADGFALHLEACATQYRPEGSPALLRRYQRLLREAERAGIAAAGDAHIELEVADSSQLSTMASTVASRLNECSTPEARTECVVRILAEHVGPEHIFLWGLRGGELVQLCALPADASTQGVARAVQAQIELESECGDGATMTVGAVAKAAASIVPPPADDSTHVDGEHVLRTVSLVSRGEGAPVLAGVVVFRVHPARYTPPPANILEPLATSLLDHDDVDPVTRIA